MDFDLSLCAGPAASNFVDALPFDSRSLQKNPSHSCSSVSPALPPLSVEVKSKTGEGLCSNSPPRAEVATEAAAGPVLSDALALPPSSVDVCSKTRKGTALNPQPRAEVKSDAAARPVSSEACSPKS